MSAGDAVMWVTAAAGAAFLFGLYLGGRIERAKLIHLQEATLAAQDRAMDIQSAVFGRYKISDLPWTEVKKFQ